MTSNNTWLLIIVLTKLTTADEFDRIMDVVKLSSNDELFNCVPLAMYILIRFALKELFVRILDYLDNLVRGFKEYYNTLF